MGDPAGIGGEIIAKLLMEGLPKRSIPVVIGDLSLFKKIEKSLHSPSAGRRRPFGKGAAGDYEFLDLGLLKKVEYGKVDPVYGDAAYRYIMEALRLILSGQIAALVTCPISKASIHMAGVPFPGHTELLAHFGGVNDYVMMMAARKIKVSLVTIHIPIHQVPSAITVNNVFKTIRITHLSLQSYFGIAQPQIKVCGLNPHAGEDGLIGKEENAIREAIASACSYGIDVKGPYPADTLFAKRDCDAYVAMYHDQGLIPVKTVDFRHTVNITLGLPFIRTSPGHGTGFDIAGKGVADPAGLIEAYRVAERMSRRL